MTIKITEVASLKNALPAGTNRKYRHNLSLHKSLRSNYCVKLWTLQINLFKNWSRKSTNHVGYSRYNTRLSQDECHQLDLDLDFQWERTSVLGRCLFRRKWAPDWVRHRDPLVWIRYWNPLRRHDPWPEWKQVHYIWPKSMKKEKSKQEVLSKTTSCNLMSDHKHFIECFCRLNIKEESSLFSFSHTKDNQV